MLLFEVWSDRQLPISSGSGVVTINSTLSFELQPQEADDGVGGDEEGVHLLFSTRPLEGDSSGGCGVSHAAVPPIHSVAHTRRVRPTLTTTPTVHFTHLQSVAQRQKQFKPVDSHKVDLSPWQQELRLMGHVVSSATRVTCSDVSLLCLQSKRDILSETKYIELVLVADHQEVSECITATGLLPIN